MADTIITNSPEKGDGGATAGWVVALIIVAVLVVGGIVLYQSGAFRAAPAAAPGDSTNINVTIPESSAPVLPATDGAPAEEGE